MATKEITKRAALYPEPELEPELISVPDKGNKLVEKMSLLWENRLHLGVGLLRARYSRRLLR